MMKIDVSLFSDRNFVRILNREDVPLILSLCVTNPQYYRHCPPFVTQQSVIDDMKALPPGKDDSDKYYIGYFDRDKLIAVMDFIMAYPDKETAFIGFFMTDASVQNAGVGSGIIDELCRYLKNAGLSGVKLGWVSDNPQAVHFWHRNGFRETGVTYDTDSYTVTVAKRELTDCQPNNGKPPENVKKIYGSD